MARYESQEQWTSKRPYGFTRAKETISQTLSSSRHKLNLKEAFHHRSVVAARLPSRECQPEKVLPVSCRPDCDVNQNPVNGCESDRRRDLNFSGSISTSYISDRRNDMPVPKL
jgi:hypothetical protein